MGETVPRILLLQVRGKERAEEQERRCFQKACGADSEELATWNLVHRPDISWSDVAGARVLLLGGAGEHSATQVHDFSRRLDEVLVRWISEGRPFFGSCYGHHVLAKLYGARLEVDETSEEIGTFDVELTESGATDPIFLGMPTVFPVQLGHHDRLSELPAELVELANSEKCSHQALKVKDKPAYGTQFHPELDAEHMRERLLMYREGYLNPDHSFDEFLAGLRSTPEALQILPRFLAAYAS